MQMVNEQGMYQLVHPSAVCRAHIKVLYVKPYMCGSSGRRYWRRLSEVLGDWLGHLVNFLPAPSALALQFDPYGQCAVNELYNWDQESRRLLDFYSIIFSAGKPQ